MLTTLTSSSFTLRDKLALQRTRLANERTLLTYVRTSLALVGFGLALIQLEPRRGETLGVGAIVAALLFMAVGFIRYRTRRREIDAATPDPLREEAAADSAPAENE